MRKGSTNSRRAHGIANGYRSGLEERIAASLTARGVDFHFEKFKLFWEPLVKTHIYTPDFFYDTRDGGSVYIESKGYFTSADRMKMLAVERCNPNADIRFVFQRANTPINKGSKTTYGAWATKHGFMWAEKDVPDAWLLE